MKILNKKNIQKIFNGSSTLQIKQNVSLDNIKIDLTFDKYITKISNLNKSVFFKNVPLNRTIKLIRKRYGYPVNGQRTRSNARTSLNLKNKYKS